jgi:hypothetical protein
MLSENTARLGTKAKPLSVGALAAQIHPPRGFLHWRTFGLRAGNRSLCRFCRLRSRLAACRDLDGASLASTKGAIMAEASRPVCRKRLAALGITMQDKTAVTSLDLI